MMQVVRLCGFGFIRVPLLLLCLLAGFLFAAPEDFEGKPIGIIVFEPKQQPLPAAEMAQILPVKSKEPLRMADIRDAILRLYATGRYTDIAVAAEMRDGDVILRFITKNNWFVGRVSVEGVPNPPSRDQLANTTQLDLGSLFLHEDEQEAMKKLQQLLRSNGYYEAQIESQFEYEPRTEQVNIRFLVEPGERYRFGSPVIQGDPQRSAKAILRSSEWKGWFGWKPITATRVQRGLERIRHSYQKQDHLMAQVSLMEMKPNPGTHHSIPMLNVEAGPVVTVETEGAKMSRDQLKRLIPVYEEQSVDRDLLVEGARNLTEYFQGKGYFNVRVQFNSDPANGMQRQIVYDINRGERQKLVHLEIRGNHYFDLMTIRERMYVTPSSLQFRRGRFSESLLRRDLDAISDLYRANGFRDVEVTSKVQQNYQGREGDVAVFVEIHEGDQWFVDSLQLEGLPQADEETIRSILQSAPGQAFSEANVATDRDNILAYYYNGGYPSASFEWSFQPSSKPNRVDLRYVITAGPRQFVREVLINGLRATRPQLVYRQILLNPGDPISQAKILETQRRLYDLGIFAKVDTAIQNPDGDEQYKYVLFQLDESRKYSISTGFGAEIARIGGSLTSFESPAGQAGFSPRVSFDFSRLNFLGRAHTVSFRSRISTLQRRALVTYTAPQFRGKENLDVSFTSLFDDSRDVRTFSARRWEGSTQFTHRWTRSKTLFYRFAFRRVGVDEATLKIRPELIPLLAQPVRVGMLSASYVDDRRDDPTDSHKGTFNSLDLGAASRIFGSQANFSRLLARNSTYHPIGHNLVLARTTSFGWLQTIRQNPDLPPGEQDIPLPERFFAGGASSHRGFPENQAGPRDPVTGFPLGGKALLLFGTELRFPLFGENLGGVIFHDAGNVYSKIQNISFRIRQHDNSDFDYMVHAVGFGVRYRTPIGPIRVDLAFVPNSPRFFGFKGTREELLFGGGVQTQQRISQFQFHFSLGQSF